MLFTPHIPTEKNKKFLKFLSNLNFTPLSFNGDIPESDWICQFCSLSFLKFKVEKSKA